MNCLTRSWNSNSNLTMRNWMKMRSCLRKNWMTMRNWMKMRSC